MQKSGHDEDSKREQQIGLPMETRLRATLIRHGGSKVVLPSRPGEPVSQRLFVTTISFVVLGLSVLLFAVIVWGVSTASQSWTGFAGETPRSIASIAPVLVGALLVVASGVLVVLLRSGRADPVEPERADVLNTGMGATAASEPLFKQRLASLTAPTSPGDTAYSGAGISPIAASCYDQVGLDLALLFVAMLARTGFDLGGFLNRTVDLLAERCAWGRPPDHPREPVSGNPEGKEQVHVALFLTDERGEWATLQAASSMSGKELVIRGLRVRRGDETSVGWVMRERRMWRGSGSNGAYLATPELMGMRSTIAIPLVTEAPPVPAPGGSGEATALSAAVSGDLVGVLDVRSGRENAFGADDVEGLARIASYLGVCICTARRLRDATAAPGTPGPYYEIANRLSVVQSEGELYAVILDALRDFGPMRVVIVKTAARAQAGSKSNADMGEFYVVVDAPETESFSASGLAELMPPSLIDIVIMGLALDHPLWVGDLGVGGGRHSQSRRSGSRDAFITPTVEGVESPELASALLELSENSDVEAVAFVPLRLMGQSTAGNARVGGILVLYGAAHRFSPLERHLHELLADLGGMALERSRLLSEAGAQLAREQRLTGIRERLRASLDPDVILRTTVQELGRVLGAELTTVELAVDFDAGQQPIVAANYAAFSGAAVTSDDLAVSDEAL